MNQIHELNGYIGYLAYFAYEESQAHEFVFSTYDKIPLQPPIWYWMFKIRVFA